MLRFRQMPSVRIRQREFFDRPEWAELFSHVLAAELVHLFVLPVSAMILRTLIPSRRCVPLLGFLYVFKLYKDVSRSAETYSG